MDNRIAIIGISCKFPQSDDVLKFRELLVNGKQTIDSVPESRLELQQQNKDCKYEKVACLKDIEFFDNEFWHIGSKEALQMAPEQRLSLETACNAVINAGYSLNDFKGSNCGVFVASTNNHYEKRFENQNTISFLTGHSFMVASYIAYYMDLHGPNMFLDTGCSSSLLAIHEACSKLILREADYFLAGGTSIYLEFPKAEGSVSLGVEAKSNVVKPFDKDADGIYSGEGCGFVLLKCYEDAVKDRDNIYAVIDSSAANNDGSRSTSLIAPCVEGQKEAILKCWTNSCVKPEEITEIEAHGTGTKLGDPIEIESVTQSFEHFGLSGLSVNLGTVKANIGHLLYAAGVASVIRKILEFRFKENYKLVNFSSPNPLIDFGRAGIYPVKEYSKYISSKKRVCGINAFSFSGTNVHLLLEEYKNTEKNEESATDIPAQLIKLSVHSPYVFKEYCENLIRFIECQDLSLEDLSYTLNTGRDDFNYRKIYAADSVIDFVNQLKKETFEIPEKKFKDSKVVFLLCQGKTEKFDQSLCADIQKYKAAGILNDILLADEFGKALINCKIEEFAEISEKYKELSSIEKIPVILENLRKLSQKNKLIILNFSGKEFSFEDSENCVFCDAKDFNKTIEKAYLCGKDINWKAFYENKPVSKVMLNSYSFNKTKFWEYKKDISSENKLSESENKQIQQFSNVEEITEKISKIWSGILGSEIKISENDDFFECGGDSVLVSVLLEDLNEAFGQNLKLDELYEASTIQKQCDLIAEKGINLISKNKEEENREFIDEKIMPLTSMQKIVYYTQKNQPKSAQWNLSFPLRIEGDLNRERLEEACNFVISNHDLLKSYVIEREGIPYFEIQDSVKLAFICKDFSDMESIKAENAARNELKDLAMVPLQYENSPLLKVYVYKINAKVNYFMVVFNHIAVDGWSGSVFFKEMFDFYLNGITGITDDIVSYGQYYKQVIDCENHKENLKWWKEKTVDFKAKRVKNIISPVEDSMPETVKYMIISKELTNQAKELEKKYHLTEFQLLVFVFQLTISHFLQSNDTNIGLVLSNRGSKLYSKTIGFIANVASNRFKFDDELTVSEGLTNIRKELISIMNRQDCCVGEYLVDDLDERKPGIRDVMDFLFVYENFGGFDVTNDKLKVSSFMTNQRCSFGPFTMVVLGSNEAIVGSVEYDRSFVSSETADYLIRDFKRIFEKVIKNENEKIVNIIKEN